MPARVRGYALWDMRTTASPGLVIPFHFIARAYNRAGRIAALYCSFMHLWCEAPLYSKAPQVSGSAVSGMHGRYVTDKNTKNSEMWNLLSAYGIIRILFTKIDEYRYEDLF